MSTINGTPGDDILSGTSGSDTFNGSTGFDTARVAAGSGDAVFSLDAQGRWVVSSPQGVDTLDSIEAVQFADGAVGLGQGEFRVNTSTAFDQTQPVLTSLPDGSFLATWLTGANVRAQRFDENGVPTGEEIASPTLGPQPPVAQHHDTVALADGGYLIAAVTGDMSSYTDRYGTHFAVVPVIAVLHFGSDGAFVGAWGVAQGERLGNGARDVLDPSITALSDGNFLVTWTASFATSQGGSGSSLVARRLDSSGAPLDAAVTLASGWLSADVAALSGGGYALASAHGSGDITVQHFDGTGVGVGDPTRIGTVSSLAPKIAALSDGGSVVIWIEPAGDGFDAYGQRVDSAGSRPDAAVRVNTSLGSVTAQPIVTALHDGGYVVAWASQQESGDDTHIHAQRFDAAGARVGGETAVNTAIAGLQQQPSLTALEDGGFVVGWMSSGQGADGWDIHAQRFDSSGAPVPSGHALQGDGNANTLLFAGTEPVHLLGEDGDDVLQGGSGGDLLDGGAGSDTAVSPDLHSAITWQLTADRVLRMTGAQAGSDALQSVERVHAEGALIGVQFEGNTEVRLAGSGGSPSVALQAPHAAVLLDGGAVVVWERYGTDAGVYAQRFDESGTAAGAAMQFEGGKAAVAALDDGGYVLAWSFSQDEANATADIDLQRFNASGAVAGPTVRVNTTDAGDQYQADPTVAALPGGGYVVAWTKVDYPDGGVFTRQFDRSGLPVTPETQVNTTPGPFPGEQSIAALSDGGYVITWTMGDVATWPNEPGYDIYAQHFDSNGTPMGGQARINATTTGHQVRSDVAALGDGGYLVTWMNYNDPSIKAQRFDETGARVGGEMLVNPSTPHSDASGPVVTALADGGYVVGWTSGDGSGSGITVQRFDATDALVGTESRVSTTMAGDQSQPVLTALDDGGYMVTWLSHQSERYSIDTQRFDANNLREGHLTLTGGTEDNVLRVTSASEGVELIGGGGRDILAGAGGWDVLAGGSDGDTFEFAAAANGVDTITDWGSGDRIAIAGASFTGAVTAGTGAATALNAVESSTAAGNTMLYVGTDATPGADVVIRLTGSFAADSFTLRENLIEARTGVVVTGRGHLVGGPGDDTLIGLHGITSMEGGAGNDTYVIANPNDRLIEQAGGGIDEVRSEWSYALGDNLERLVLAGERPTRGTGNELDNVITGNGARNVLTGGAGADTLSGGAGADLFVYRSVAESGAAAGSWDVVLDFSSLEGDRIDLRDIDANPARPGKQGFTFIGAAGFSSTDATGQLRFDAGTHLLSASTDADPQAEMAIELAGVSILGAGDLNL